jgi:hypothetical protein
MEQKYFERLRYLETVRREEIKQKIIVARAFGNLDNNPDYDAAREEQAENEMEILRLKNRDPQVMAQFAPVKHPIDVWAYIDNEDFLSANLEKTFSAGEMVALVIRSENVSLKQKIADLRTLAENVEEDLRCEIEAWIKQKEEHLAYLMNLNSPNLVFVEISHHPVGVRPGVFQKLEDAVANTWGSEVFLECINAGHEKISTLARVKLCHKDGETRQEISDVLLMRYRYSGGKDADYAVCEFDENAPHCSKTTFEKMYDIQVDLAFPYQAGDLVCVDFSGENYFVIADSDSSKVQERLAASDIKRDDRPSWLPMNIPAWFVYTTNRWCSADVQLVPEINIGGISMNNVYKVIDIPQHIQKKIDAINA